jgi:sn-glycerol 3-phosphate transport system ATP-binding protein
VQGFEYLGADLVLRCQVGSELLTARVPGHAHADLRPGQGVILYWPQQAAHWFDAQGGRIHVCGQAVESARSLLAAA